LSLLGPQQARQAFLSEEESIVVCRFDMGEILASLKALPLLAVCTWAAASYPVIPQDKTTPVQQRLAVEGFNGTS
jgi:hypothetical protein